MKRLSDIPQVMTRFLTQNRCRLFSFSARYFSSKINAVIVCFLLAQRSNAPRTDDPSVSRLESPTGAENPPQQEQADRNEQRREAEAAPDADVALTVKTPAEAADEIDDGIDQADGAPERRQHVVGIKRAAEEGQRRHDQGGNDRELLEILRPDADDEAKQAEGD